MEKERINWNVSPIPSTDKDKEGVDEKDLDTQKAKRYADDTEHRRNLVVWVICVTSAWLVFVVVTFLCIGGDCLSYSDSVIIALLTTTTINVLGLPLVVLKGLFGKD